MKRTLLLCTFVAAFGLVACGPPTPEEAKPAGPTTYQLSVTGAGQALSRVTAEPVDEAFPAIAPDGATLLFNVLTYRVVESPGFAPRRTLEQATIAGVDPNTGARRTLYTSSNSKSFTPAWLPAGNAFVFSSDSPGAQSLVRSLSNSPNAAVTVVVSGQVAPGVLRPSVSPDGSRVAFHTQIRGVSNIGVTGLDGSRFTLIGEGEAPSWSPDGKRVAFQRFVNGYYQIFLVDPDTGTNLVQVTSGDNHNNYPCWSPDGRFLVYSSSQGWNTMKGATIETRNLFVIKPDGTGLTQLTLGQGKSLQPSWGRDGWIYFASNQAGNMDIWRLKPVLDTQVAPPSPTP